jgi:trimeric autotransporter adhesin
MRKLFTLKYLLIVLFLGASSLQGWGQIVAWNNNTLSGVTAGSLNATTNNTNLNTAVLSRGAGITASSLTGGYASNNWVGASQAIAITNNLYYQCTITANSGFQASLSTLDFKLRRSGSGPNAYIWRYSIDGTNFTDIGSSVPFTTTTATGDVQPQINLSAIAALQNVASGTTITLRLYAWGGAAAGTLAFGTGNVNSLAIGGTVTATNPTPTTTSISPAAANAGSGGFALTVNGTNFINGASTVTWNGANRTTAFVNSTELTATIPASDILTAGSALIGVTTTGAPALSNTQTFTINATGGASLSLTSALPGFGSVCINTTSAASSFTLDGSNLDGSPITIAALPGFTYSETAGGTYTATLSFTYTGNSFTGKVIYVKFTPTAVQSYNGNIELSGGGLAAAYPVAATGAGINSLPAVTTGGSSAVTATAATLAATINAAGCGAIIAYGFEYSTATGFPEGTGIQVAASNLNTGNFSVTLTGLIPNTRYFYKAYAVNTIDTTYGAEQFFTNAPLPVPMAAQTDLSFTETFADIANWNNFFVNGIGANHWDGLSATATAPASGIPNPIILTASTNSFQTPITPGSNVTAGGVQKGTDQLPPTQSIVFLSTGSPDNTTAAAIDFYMDFTGVNAGTLSFDYATLNNATGNRNGSLRVYGTVDGITFTELPFASVLDFTNNIPISGSKSNIILPAIFNNSATARLRFYYHNGSGNTGSGSRPKISIDNLNVTAVATTPCVSPTAPATALNFGTITDVSIQGSFTGTASADGYLVVMSSNSSLTSNPVDGQIYNIGDNVGDGSVVAKGSATNFTATGLTPLTTYYFFIFSMNGVCTGGPLYYTASILNGNAATIAGLPACTTPALQPTALILNPPPPTINTIQGSFTATTADEYLVLRSTSATLTSLPVNAQVYNAGDVLGNAIVVQRSAAAIFTANGLLPATQYYFFVFSLNSQGCVNGPAYNITNPLTGTETTQPLPPCITPTAQPNSLALTASNTAVAGTFTGTATADAYLIIRSTSPALLATPADNTDYNAGDNLGGGIVVASSNNTTFLTTGLSPNTTYYFFIFAASKNCSGGTKYFTTSPLTGNIVTSNAISNNYYFGTLHSHSDYSDGNKDNPGFTPTDDYNYALNSLCMDYLGISEHNHFSSPDNPGNTITNYHSGITQAAAFNVANSNFVALYGMEWGVISGGGHVLIYGDGMDNLWGWETGSGGWGAANNYDVFVPKSVYTGSTGLFKTVNDNIATNTFASLAHPGLTDFNGIGNNIPYDAVADNAITAVAVESGPANSTNNTYSNPGPSMSLLWYYQTLLSKGYHAGPAIDHDNHYTTFGRTTFSRTAIVAPALTKTAIVTAMRNMSFYATQDCDSKVDFTINTKILGTAFTDRFGPNISVVLTDATTSTSAAVIRVMFGIPGSGVLPVKIDSVIGNTLNFTDNNLANLATGYYYIDITNGTSRIVTAPIWYTRNDAPIVLPIRLSSFLVQKIDNSAKISWATEQETNTSHFIIERSVDGRTWNTIATVAAAGNSSSRVTYNAYDNAPIKGINYYRLKQVDKDAKFEYSAVRTALFKTNYTAQVTPNPAKDFINLYINKLGNQAATIQLLNTEGKIVYSTVSSQSNLQISTAGISQGLYFVKVIDANNVTTLRVVVQ